jgi:hypothetical protein
MSCGAELDPVLIDIAVIDLLSCAIDSTTLTRQGFR